MGKDLFSEYTVDYRAAPKIEKTGHLSSKGRQVVKVVAKPNTVLKEHDIVQFNEFSTKKLKNEYKNKKKTLKPKLNIKHKLLIYKILMSFFILSLTLLVTVIIINKFSTLKDEITPTFNITDENEINYSEFLAPVVMHDPKTFGSPEEAENQMKISSSIWRCVMKNGTNKYKEYDDRGLSLIPVDDIKKSCIELFGQNHGVNFTERTFGPFYSFDGNEKFFHICAISNQDSYLPFIEDIKKESNNIIINVSYVLRDDPFFKETTEKPAEPTKKKHMTYEIKSVDNFKSYFLNSVSNNEKTNERTLNQPN